jgi:hypothetical protein
MRLDHVRWALAALLALGLTAAAAPQSGDAKGKPVSAADKLRRDMDQAVSLDISEQPLHLAINQLREQTKINFVLDKVTMGAMGMDPEQMPVTLKLKDAKLRTALRTLLNPFNLSFVILDDTVLITTDDMAMHRQMRQRVNVDLDNAELASSLRQMARETATNIVLDPRVAKEAQAKVTLQLEDVPLEMAVRLMAEMAGLRPVRVGNTLFVCSKAAAKELREDPDLYPPQPKVTPDGIVLPPGANPFGPGMPGLPGVLPGIGGIGGGPGLPAVPARERAPMADVAPPPPPPPQPKEERREEPRPEKPGDR